MWCPIGEGHADSKDPESPQKLDLYFDTPTGKKLGTKPAWILKTDYTRYCIICAFYIAFNNISTKHRVMCKVCWDVVVPYTDTHWYNYYPIYSISLVTMTVNGIKAG